MPVGDDFSLVNAVVLIMTLFVIDILDRLEPAAE